MSDSKDLDLSLDTLNPLKLSVEGYPGTLGVILWPSVLSP